MQVINAADQSYDTLWTDEEKKYYDQFPLTILNDLSCLLEDEEYDHMSVAWLNESPDINEHNWEVVVNNTDLFSPGDTVLRFHQSMLKKLETGDHRFKTLYTHDKRFVGLPNVKIIKPATPSYIPDNKSKIYKKTRDMVFVTSTKYSTPLHKLRVDLISPLLARNVLVFGKGVNPIKKKVKALKDFRFCLVIENGIFSGYHTEKIIDCFRTGTIPIYIGDPDIGEVFDTEGIITASPEDMENLDSFFMVNMFDPIVGSPEQVYLSKMESIERNFEIAMSYDNHPQTIVKSILKEEGFMNE